MPAWPPGPMSPVIPRAVFFYAALNRFGAIRYLPLELPSPAEVPLKTSTVTCSEVPSVSTCQYGCLTAPTAARDYCNCDASHLAHSGARRTTMSVVAETLDAYARWAPHYPPMPHNPLMHAEQRAMTQYLPQLAGRRALDLACGTGRYSRLLAAARTAEVVAVDFCGPMLQQVAGASRVRASMMDLPFADRVFDGVISGLALGHAASVETWMSEVSRVLRKQGTLLYSDFHPEAAQAGFQRSFKDENDREWAVPHRVYALNSQLEAASAAGLTTEIVHEIRVGFELNEPFPKSEEFYRRWHGLPIVLIVRARK